MPIKIENQQQNNSSINDDYDDDLSKFKKSIVNKFNIKIDNNIVSNVVPFKFDENYHTVSEFLAFKMNNFSDRIALIDYENNKKSITYKELFQKSKKVQAILINKHQLKNGERFSIYCENSFDYAITLIGIIFTGSAFIPIPIASGQFEITTQIMNSNSSILIFDYKNKLNVLYKLLLNENYRENFLKTIRLIIFINKNNDEDNNDENQLIMKSIENILKDTNCKIDYFDHNDNDDNDFDENLKIPYYTKTKQDFFAIIYTSGTTGLPKGAIHTNYSILSTLYSGINEKDEKINKLQTFWYPFTHVSGTYFLLITICNGNTNVLIDGKLELILKCCEEYRLEFVMLSPKHIIEMTKYDYNKKFNLNSLKVVWSSGSKTAVDIINKINKMYKFLFIEGYGATEFLGCFSSHDLVYDSKKLKEKIGTVGRPVPGVDSKIIDTNDQNQTLSSGKQGEILIRGAFCFYGYLNNETATKNTIDKDGWYHSGDIGYYDNDGYFYIVDRIKEIIKFRGWSVVPAEIETFIIDNSNVEHCCVVGVPHSIDGNHIRAYIKLMDNNKNIDKEKLKNEIIQSVIDNMGFQKRLRAGIEFVEHFPLTSIGKIDRKYFRNLVKNELLIEIVD